MRRFWSKVNKSAPGGCWEWTAYTSRGYGRFWLNGVHNPAHRISWEMANGPIPPGSGYHGTCVLHKCDNRKCVNPDHLFLGTQKDNVQDMVMKGRKAQPFGELNGQCTITDMQVLVIRAYGAWMTHQSLADTFGVGRSTISNIINHKRRKVLCS